MKRVDKLTRSNGDMTRESIVKGMAYFPGTGPAHTFCQQCRCFNDGMRPLPRGKFGLTLKQSCAKFKAMTGHDGPAFDGSMPSCKYFDELDRLTVGQSGVG